MSASKLQKSSQLVLVLYLETFILISRITGKVIVSFNRDNSGFEELKEYCTRNKVNLINKEHLIKTPEGFFYKT